jgi:hypothetical protein
MMMRSRVARTSLFVSLVAIGLGGCGGKDDATASERLWISSLPTSPKKPISAFLATKATDGKYIGAFFTGSLYRGGHDVFTWTPRSGGADVVFMQDGTKARLRFESCKPSTGFDHCLLVKGDPTGTVKYQSRKRWATRRGSSDIIPTQMVTSAIAELAEEDDDLEALLTP